MMKKSSRIAFALVAIIAGIIISMSVLWTKIIEQGKEIEILQEAVVSLQREALGITMVSVPEVPPPIQIR